MKTLKLDTVLNNAFWGNCTNSLTLLVCNDRNDQSVVATEGNFFSYLSLLCKTVLLFIFLRAKTPHTFFGKSACVTH